MFYSVIVASEEEIQAKIKFANILFKIDKIKNATDPLIKLAHLDFFKIATLFGQGFRYIELLTELEKRFKSFLKTHHITPLKVREGINKWYVNKQYGLPVALPIPLGSELISQPKQNQALLLFFYDQLLKLKILTPNKSLDEQLFYCAGIIESAQIEEQLAKGNLFLDVGPVNILLHGKYSHLLQFVLIGIAIELNLLTLTTPLGELVKLLIDKKNEIQTLKDKNPKTYSAWDYVLDRQSSGKLVGPEGLNLIMLSSIAKENCGLFHTYWYYSHTKKLKNQMDFEKLSGVAGAGELITRILRNPFDILVTPKEFYEKRNRLSFIGNNMYFKQERNSNFQKIEEKIRAQHGFVSVKNPSFVNPSHEATPLIPPTRRPSLFSSCFPCFYGKKESK